jgi:hypothetical protein
MLIILINNCGRRWVAGGVSQTIGEVSQYNDATPKPYDAASQGNNIAS